MSWRYGSKADFVTHFITFVGFLVAMVSNIHSYMINDDKSCFPKDGAIKGTQDEAEVLNYLIISLLMDIMPSLGC